MSSVSSLGAESNALSLVDFLTDSRKESVSILDTSVALGTSSQLLSSVGSRRAQDAYGGVTASSTIGQAALHKALSEMDANGGKVTFKDISEHREKLEKEFSAQMRVELAKLGVDPDTEFTLTMTPSGSIQVSCDDPMAKEIIKKYMSEHPEACEQFGYIQALSNLERARQSPLASSGAWREVQNSKAEYQAQAVEAFFNAALNKGMNYGSLLASFGSSDEEDTAESSTSFYTGIDFTV